MSPGTTLPTMAALEDGVAQLDLAAEKPDAASSDEVVPLEEEKEQEVFRFFDLPRELRNRIYAKTTTDIWVPLERHPFANPEEVDCALLESAPCINLALVGRQLGEEYTEEMARGSTAATLTMDITEQRQLRDRIRVNASLGLASSRVSVLTLTHDCRTISGFGRFGSYDMGADSLDSIKSCLSLLPSLKHLKLVYRETVEDFHSSWDLPRYRPEDHDPAHVRRIFSSKLDGGFDKSIAISCSVVLTENLFTPRGPRGHFPSGYRENPINRVLFHGPASLEPTEGIVPTTLEFDEAESSSFEDVEEYHSQRQGLGSEAGYRERVWIAGYRMVHEPCARSSLNWQWRDSFDEYGSYKED